MTARIRDWFAPIAPDARPSLLRRILAGFVLLDLNLIVNDPIPLSRAPELYHPLLLERALHLPGPSVPLTVTLYAVITAGCVLGLADRWPRLAGWTVAATFTWWTAIGMSYGKVDHDHLALVVALWVLPTAGVVIDRGRTGVPTASRQSGWALRCIQVAVIFTYFLSALTKIRSGGWSLSSWPESTILMWAIVRRPHGLGQFLLPYPGLLRVMQWMSILAELSSVVVLWLRGRALWWAAGFWLGFHVFTVALLYIHFAPTLICWLAFAPLERLRPWLGARRWLPSGRGAVSRWPILGRGAAARR